MLPLLGKNRGKGTVLHSEHILASAAISALIDNKIEKHCLIREPEETVKEFVLRFYDVLFDLHKRIVRPIIEAYKETIDELKDQIRKLKLCKDEKYKKKLVFFERKLAHLNKWILQVPVLGFNSRKYDLPLIKYYLPLLGHRMRRHIFDLFNPTIDRQFSIPKMIQGYKMQDARFDDHSNYVTEDYIQTLMEQQSEILGGLKCAYCDVTLDTLMRNSPNGLTLDRLDDDKPHIQGNVIIACHRCNCAHENKDIKPIIDSTEKAFANMKEGITSKSDVLQMMKKGSQVKALLSKCFHFQDILNLTAPCSLRQFIKSWGVQMGKSYFCYEAFTSPAFLKRTSLPPIEEFHSWLRNDNARRSMKNYKSYGVPRNSRTAASFWPTTMRWM